MLVPPLEQPPPSWSPLNPGQISAEAIIEAHKRQQLQQLPSSSFIPIKPLAKSGKPRRTFKVILIGDAGVGKTCLSFRFCNGRFPENTEATIGVDFRERTFEIDGELIRVCKQRTHLFAHSPGSTMGHCRSRTVSVGDDGHLLS
jgi:GTPase SAR1 family protein